MCIDIIRFIKNVVIWKKIKIENWWTLELKKKSFRYEIKKKEKRIYRSRLFHLGNLRVGHLIIP